MGTNTYDSIPVVSDSLSICNELYPCHFFLPYSRRTFNTKRLFQEKKNTLANIYLFFLSTKSNN